MNVCIVRLFCLDKDSSTCLMLTSSLLAHIFGWRSRPLWYSALFVTLAFTNRATWSISWPIKACSSGQTILTLAGHIWIHWLGISGMIGPSGMFGTSSIPPATLPRGLLHESRELFLWHSGFRGSSHSVPKIINGSISLWVFLLGPAAVIMIF